MRVIAFDPHPHPERARAHGFRYASLEALLSAADVVTLHLAGGADTHHLIGEAEFARMKEGVVFINTSRGGVVDSAALVRALASGRLGGAGLDVVAEEDSLIEAAAIFRADASVSAEKLGAVLADHTLINQANVIVTPHIAYDTYEAVARLNDATLDNIAAFDAGSARNVVPAPKSGRRRRRKAAVKSRPAPKAPAPPLSRSGLRPPP